MNQQMRKSTQRPVMFVNRQMVHDPNSFETVNEIKFDAGDLVSITGLTNALSSDIANPDISPSNSTSLSTNLSIPNIASSGVTSDIVGPNTVLGKIRSNSMMITDTKVVEDPTRTWDPCSQTGTLNGKWTFNTIIRQLASSSPSNIATDAEVSTFVKNWLNNWASSQTVNGDNIAARTAVNSKILTPWLNKSSNAGAPAGQLDMKFAPFKLIAIVNRFDLRDGQLDAIAGSPAGEGRFVFCLINGTCNAALSMTVILEYGINVPLTCADQKAWALKWYNLKDLTIGSAQYNQQLEAITDKFSLCGSNPNRPNQSSLDQLRTNEITLSNTPLTWELREFVLNGSTGLLKQSTVGQTPADKFNAQVVNSDVEHMASYVNSNATDIKAEINQVPATWETVPFLGGASRITDNPTRNPPNVFHWEGAGTTGSATFIKNDIARHKFSFNTCAGCHSGETQTSFTHVDPVFFGTQATLSGFLSGVAGKGGAIDFDGDPNNQIMSVKDAALRPSSNPTIRQFNDNLRRARGVKAAAEQTCGSVLAVSSQLLFEPTTSVH